MIFPAELPAKLRGAMRRLNPPPDPARPLFRPTYVELAVWLLFAAVTLVGVIYHEPWRDEAQGYLIVRDNTLPGLVLHMKYESQFLLWFLFTWPFVRLCGMSIFGVSLMHWAVSCCTAFLVLRRAPFRLLTRILLVSGVLFAFEYTVVMRHYALGVFLLTVLMVNWRGRFRRPVLFACGIALCASTNLLIWTCLGGLCAAIGIEVIVRRLWTRRVIAAMAVAVFGFALALAEIFNGHGFGSPYVSFRGTQLSVFDTAERIQSVVNSITRLVYLPFWLCVACFLIGAAYFAWKSVPAMVCFLTNAVLMISLQFIGGFHSIRHVGFLIVGTAVSCWIAASGDTRGFGFLRKLPRAASACLAGAAGCAAAMVLVLQAVMTPIFIGCEVKYPFSHGPATGDFIRDNIPEDVPMYCFSMRSNTSVLPELPGRKFFIFDRNEYGTYSTWGHANGLSMLEMSSAAAARLKPDQRYALFVVALNEEPNIIPGNMILLYDSTQNEHPIWGPYTEEFLVFAVVREEEKDLYRPRMPRIPPKFIPEDARIREVPASKPAAGRSAPAGN